MSASVTAIDVAREAVDTATERMDDARTEFLALSGEDGEAAAYAEFQIAKAAWKDCRDALYAARDADPIAPR